MRNRIEFHWQIQESGWHEQQRSARVEGAANRLTTSAAERAVLVAFLRAVALVAIMVLIVSAAPQNPEYDRYIRVSDEIRQMVRLQLSALRRDDRELYAQLLVDPQALAEFEGWLNPWRVRSSRRDEMDLSLIDIDFTEENMVAATVQITPPTSHWIPVPYRETQFFVLTPDGWRRTTPTATYWGEPQSVETEHLRVDFFARDADLLLPILQEVDRAYVQLNDFLPLAPARGEDRVHFTIESQIVTAWRFASMRLAVVSPHLLQLAVTDTVTGTASHGAASYGAASYGARSDHLRNAMIVRMVERALSQALLVTELHHVPEWYVVLSGLSSWLQSDMFGQAPAWQTSSVAQLDQLGEGYYPFFLSDLKSKSRLEHGQWLIRQELAYTLVDYMVRRRGVEHLPDLVAALREHDTWESLVPVVYGESVASFTRGWNLFLAEHYGLSE